MNIFLFLKNYFLDLKVNDIILEINCIDNLKSALFKKKIINFFISYISNFSLLKKKISSNPLILLEKLKIFSKLNLPCQLNYIDFSIKTKFIFFLYTLKKLGIYFIFNPYLVRGLDYYNGIVYEWTTLIDDKKLAICSGGRYDSLSKIIGKYDSFSTGCALGIDRLMLKLKIESNIFSYTKVFFSLEQPLHINFKFFDYFNEKNQKTLECNDFSFILKKKLRNLKGIKNKVFFINKKFIKSEIS